MSENNFKITLDMSNLNDAEKGVLFSIFEKSEIQNLNRGKALIGREIEAGARFKVINVDPHRSFNKVCMDEYIGKTGVFPCKFTFGVGFEATGNFDEDYMNAIDRINGHLCWRYDEVEILD